LALKGKASSSSSSSRTSGSKRVDPDPDPEPPTLASVSPGSASFRGARGASSAVLSPRFSPRALLSQERLASNAGSTAVTCTHAPSPASPDGGKGEIAGNARVPAAELTGVRLAWSERSISPSVRSRGSRWIHVLPFRPSASQASPTSRTR
jgi:hypothetical protein